MDNIFWIRISLDKIDEDDPNFPTEKQVSERGFNETENQLVPLIFSSNENEMEMITIRELCDDTNWEIAKHFWNVEEDVELFTFANVNIDGNLFPISIDAPLPKQFMGKMFIIYISKKDWPKLDHHKKWLIDLEKKPEVTESEEDEEEEDESEEESPKKRNRESSKSREDSENRAKVHKK